MAKNNKQKDVFILKHVGLGNTQSLLIGMANSGIIKVTHTENSVTITIWDDVCENIINTVTYDHEMLVKKPSNDK